jgi:peptidoglycan/LPS O-acetylase OafA/YrhL
VSGNASAIALKLRSEYQLPKVIPQLDRLRGLAILMVLICHVRGVIPHAVNEIAEQGWVGVDLFFVLSGFLITGILWEARESKVYFLRFYERRVLRIWPAYLLLLLFAFCILPVLRRFLGGLILSVPSESLGLWAYLLMIQNLFASQFILSHILPATWSLAIEEQFYLVWPAVIRRASLRVVLPCLFAGFLVAPFLRLWAAYQGFSRISVYYNTLTHYDGLLCGAIVAIWLRSARPKRSTLLIAGVVLFFAGFALFLPIHPSAAAGQDWSPLVVTSVALLSTGLLLAALVSENLGSFLHRFFFMNRTLSFLGFISYSLYLYHFPILQFTMSARLVARLDWWHHTSLTRYLLVICGVGLSVLMAWISRVTLERAALSKKGIFG